MGEPLTPSEQLASRSERGKLIRTSQISRHGALYDASISAQTSESAGHVVLNPIDFDDVIEVYIAKSDGDLKAPHIRGYGDFLANIYQKMRTELIPPRK